MDVPILTNQESEEMVPIWQLRLAALIAFFLGFTFGIVSVSLINYYHKN
jgi:hypothetical protein